MSNDITDFVERKLLVAGYEAALDDVDNLPVFRVPMITSY